jgi:hypothetical protein
MLRAALLHVAPRGVKAVNRKYETVGRLSVSLDDVKNFRQLESRCPGHPKRQPKEQLQRRDGKENVSPSIDKRPNVKNE